MTTHEKAPGEGGNSKIQNTGVENIIAFPDRVKSGEDENGVLTMHDWDGDE